jgi:hypothetical protein
MNSFERFCFNLLDRWMKAQREQYSRLCHCLLSALRGVHETVAFFIRPEDPATVGWEPGIWLPKIMDCGTPKNRQDLHCIDSPENRIQRKLGKT